MDFRNEYLSQWVKDEKYEKAELLWLYYDYHTEVFDQRLVSSIPSRLDEGSWMPTTYGDKTLSDKNAQRFRFIIYEAARYYDISDKTMQDTKNNTFRCSVKMNKRLDLYEEYQKEGKFNFMMNR